MKFKNMDEAEAYFVDSLEYGGVPITKENFEDLFEMWLEDEEIEVEEIN